MEQFEFRTYIRSHTCVGTLLIVFLTLFAANGCSSGTISMDQLERQSQSGSSKPALVSDGLSLGLLDVEKPQVKLGFIKLTDCAPLVIAKEKGFFEAEGLEVELEAQSNWKVLLDRVVDGQIDGAHMLAGQPIGAAVGFGTKADVITGYSLDYNGNAITVSNQVWETMLETEEAQAALKSGAPIPATALRPILSRFQAEARDFNMGMVFPVSTHNYEVRYWLASAGIHPGFYTPTDINGMTEAEVLLSVTPPPQMPSTLEAGTIQGYCVGEPWNQQAIAKGIGVPVITNAQIWKDNPEKVFAVMRTWDEKYPNTHIAIVKALMRAGKWLDAKDASGQYVNRNEATALLSLPHYVGADPEVIAASMTGTYRFAGNDVRPMPDFVLFFDKQASYPHYSDCIWFLTQMRRWGQIPESKPAAWYEQTARSIYRPDIYRKAAELLIAEGHLTEHDLPPRDYDGYRPPTSDFIDGKLFDGKKPLEYIAGFEIGQKDK
ncbi:MAG: ABC transporter substrate-binding protein [Planctomycetaceae bacterium]|nr:ABC transporter substrate-binding protein [Planctomycetaceae bacterium]